MDTPAEMAERFGLGAIDQISFVVADLEEAIGRYQLLFGPFWTTTVTMDITYRHRPSWWRPADGVKAGGRGFLDGQATRRL
jgi:hypothetical protein